MSSGEIIIISGPAGSGKTLVGDALMAQYGRPQVRRFEWPRDCSHEIVEASRNGHVCIVETVLDPKRVRLRVNLFITTKRGAPS